MKRPTASDIDFNALERETGFGWGWFTALGLALFGLGTFALVSLPPAATTVSLNVVGMLMLIGAFAQLATRLLVPDWGGRGFLVPSAVLYGAAGALVMANPDLAAKLLTFMLACALIFSGLIRIWLSMVMPPSLPGWGWIAASGLMSIAAGILFIAGWPTDTVWLLGVVLAVDLTFQGAMAIAFGLTLKAISK